MDDKLKVDLILLEELTTESRRIEKEIDEIKARVITILPVGTKVQAANGTFSIAQRSKWKYSPELEAQEKSVKESQKTEQQTGLAIESKGDPYLLYRAVKEGDV